MQEKLKYLKRHLKCSILLLLLHLLSALTGTNLNGSKYKSCGINQTEQCVPYELCNEGMTIANKFYPDRTRSVLDEQCHYMEKCCEIESILNEPAANLNETNYRRCGYRLDNWFYLRPFGYKLKEAKFAEFPWIVAIFDVDKIYLCSGALLTPEVVITAAHCVESAAPIDKNTTLLVYAGEWDAAVELEPLPHQSRYVKEIIIHENYTKTPVMHNLALLLLEDTFSLAPHIQTICLPTPQTNFNYTQCFVSGWDRDEFVQQRTSKTASALLETPTPTAASTPAPTPLLLPTPSSLLSLTANKKEIMLKKLPMFALPSDQCAAKIRLAILGRRYTLHDSFICTGGDKHDFVCRSGIGAGGVPLVCAINGCERYFLAGLLARGARCDGAQLLGVYTNIKFYRPWIDLKLRQRDLDIRYYM